MAQAKQRGTYPDNWKELARLVKDEAGWKCVRCGHAHDPAAGYCLTVHHFSGNKDDNSRYNLISACQRCHLSLQARVNPATPIVFDPSPWALPYIAGVYEAGICIPSPLYGLARWISEYEAKVGPWPHWAPRPAVPQPEPANV